MNPEEFASDKFPIRCSELAKLSRCLARSYMLYEDIVRMEGGDESGSAADTGSLAHVGVAEFHRHPDDKLEIRKGKAWEAIMKASALGKFPLADPDEVRLNVEPYFNDPRNIYAIVPLIEHEIKFSIPPHRFDSTHRPIVVEGHIDQVRLDNNQLKVWDFKTGKPSGMEMLFEHNVQIAAYTYGVRFIPGYEKTEPGGIIRSRGYRTRSDTVESPPGVFFHAPFLSGGLDLLLEDIRLKVALVRMGEIPFSSGPWCSWCKYGPSMDTCIAELQGRLVRLSLPVIVE